MVMVVVMLIFILQVTSFSVLTGVEGVEGLSFSVLEHLKQPSKAPLSSGGKVARACCQRANYRSKGRCKEQGSGPPLKTRWTIFGA